MSQYKISFEDKSYEPQMVSEGQSLSEELTASNSPLLFGCRTGICGTCVVEVEPSGELAPPDEDEQEILEIYAEDNPKARLACQVCVSCDMHIKPLDE